MTEHPDIDIKENYIKCLDDELLSILLKDRSSGKNIIWATDTYAEKGAQYDAYEHITVKLITGRFGKVIRPRIDKSQKEQKIRIKDKAEVFTPSWICNEMNNHLSDEWFEKKNVFNTEKEKTWITSKNKIQFSNEDGKTWQDYVKSKVLEISCGEAPFLVSRYDTTTGQWIEVNDRIGALDRKLRVVNEQCDSEPDWYNWTLEAFKSTYGYEWQGDSLLIARENLLFTFIDYYIAKFENFPIKEYLIEIAKILSWNIWQMDGLKYVIPNSCKPTPKRQMSLFQDEEDTEPCAGCIKNDNSRHTGIYCKIMNWETKRSIKFFKGEKRMKFDFVIGNPPYQDKPVGDNITYAPPVYNYFLENSYNIGKVVELIHPARFLFDAGSTPKDFNNRMLNNPHVKVVYFESDSKKLFGPTVGISGGVAVTYYDVNKNFGAIKIFTPEKKMNDILQKVMSYDDFRSMSDIVVSRTSYRLTEKLHTDYPDAINYLSKGHRYDMSTNIFDRIPFVFYDQYPEDGHKYAKILGRTKDERVYKFIRRDYINNVVNFENYKFFLPKANGNGVGKDSIIIGTPEMGAPFVGNTETFISIGNFKTEKEMINSLKYVKSRFSRFLLSILKTTQDITPEKWKYVPLQNFTEKSDIDWSKSIHEIDLQLYKKYGLDDTEISFIESHIKEMK